MAVALEIVRKDAWVPDELASRLRQWAPKSDLGRIVRACFGYLPPELAADLLDRIVSCVIVESALSLVRINGPYSERPGTRDDYGIVSRKVVTTAGVNYLAGYLAGGAQVPTNWKYHGIGTGTTAEATSDTALVTELTTQYNPDNTRATGTQSNPSGNVFQTLGTNTVDATAGIQEHGVFTQAATGGGTLLDRSEFAVVNLSAADSLQSQYQLTLSAGG